jgi:Cd2+/Zn2+-exporting ATPase
MGQIRRIVEEAQEQKAPIERLLNRYAKLYTPVALLLGAGVWFFTGDVLHAIKLLMTAAAVSRSLTFGVGSERCDRQ